MKTRPWIDVTELESPSDPDAANAVMAASSILYALSGQRYGGIFQTTEQYVCDTTGAPTGCQWDPGASAYWNPAIGSYAYVQGPSRASLRLTTGSQIRLRNRPVQEIVSLTINGETVDSSQYRLINGAILEPSSSASWGLCSGPLVTYNYGVNPSILGKMAARRLANELLLSFHNDPACGLPSNVTSVSRQGLSFDIYDPQDFMDNGKLGLYEVDLFLSVVNPGKARKRPRVFSPDMPRAQRNSSGSGSGGNYYGGSY